VLYVILLCDCQSFIKESYYYYYYYHEMTRYVSSGAVYSLSIKWSKCVTVS